MSTNFYARAPGENATVFLGKRTGAGLVCYGCGQRRPEGSCAKCELSCTLEQKLGIEPVRRLVREGCVFVWAQHPMEVMEFLLRNPGEPLIWAGDDSMTCADFFLMLWERCPAKDYTQIGKEFS